MSTIAPKRALISVSEKAGIEDLARALIALNVEILSTGGTAKTLRDAGIAVTDVSEVTEHPEIMDGRVKTLHPRIHGGILARRSHKGDQDAMSTHNITGIDIVVVNLYPFEATVASGAKRADIIENIDIGGPAMVRAAAKNHEDVVIVTDAEDYQALIQELAENNGHTRIEFRQNLASIAYARTAAYDAAIASWMSGELGEKFPRRIVEAATRADVLRYGENPHQDAAFYQSSAQGFSNAQIIQGKALSYNNINDADAAWALIQEFAEPACAIIKHANPCGVAEASDVVSAYQNALKCYPVSAFGGIVAINRALEADAAEAILGTFTEVVIAPEVSDAAKAVFAQKPNIRLIVMQPSKPEMTRKEVAGGWLVQDADYGVEPFSEFHVVTDRKPSEDEYQDLLFAWKVAKHVKSNAIIYAKGNRTVGIGAGQMSRVDSARIAARKSEDMDETNAAQGSVVASDAFFPFADGLLQAAEAGATAIIQPGGSMRDDEVIKAANEAGLAMVFTGRRHFRH